MKKVVITLVALVSIIGITFAQGHELLSFVIYGRNHMVGVALPDSWTVNMNMANRMGVNGFFLLEQFTPNDTPATIFLRLGSNDGSTTLQKFAERMV
ncbi:hypothetical protein FACS1894190_01580 [Spirochaetia bacterium]|nr:hypothetical protein FACS1894190_01580 [Spirochaetia bacterium]